MKKLMTVLFALVIYPMAHAGLLYTYNQLTLMELDQMEKLVREKIKESKKADAKTVPLKEGLQAVYSRPNPDRMIDKVSAPLRIELEKLDEYERILTELTDEALNALKNTKNFKPVVQVTYLMFLENLMADIKGQAMQAAGFERDLIKKIQKAKIKLTKEAENEKNVKGFRETKSPSETANLIVEAIEKADKEALKAQKEGKKPEADKQKSEATPKSTEDQNKKVDSDDSNTSETIEPQVFPEVNDK